MDVDAILRTGYMKKKHPKATLEDIKRVIELDYMPNRFKLRKVEDKGLMQIKALSGYTMKIFKIYNQINT